MSADVRDRTGGRSDPRRAPRTSGAEAGPPAGAVPTPRPDDGRTGEGRLTGEDRSIPQLLRELSGEATDLVQNEVALAKAEMSEKVDVFQRNLVAIAVGGAFLLSALLLLAWAVNTGLTALLSQVMSLEIAVWLSPLILAAVLGAIGWGMIQKGKSAIGDEGIVPRRTTDTLREDKEWAKTKARQLKEEAQHG